MQANPYSENHFLHLRLPLAVGVQRSGSVSWVLRDSVEFSIPKKASPTFPTRGGRCNMACCASTLKVKSVLLHGT